jgi:hypothetical protein
MSELPPSGSTTPGLNVTAGTGGDAKNAAGAAGVGGLRRGWPMTPAPTSASAATGASARLVTVHAVNWHNVLDFTQLFRGFRLAINPAKLLLALLAIMLIYAAGRLFDAVWGPQVARNEVQAFAEGRPLSRSEVLRRRTDRLDSLLRDISRNDDTLTPERIAILREDPAAAFRAIKGGYRARFESDLRNIAERRKRDEEQAKDSSLRILVDRTTPAEREQRDRAEAARRLLTDVTDAREAAGQGIFDTFLHYEIAQFDRLVENTLTFVRVSPVRSSSTSDFGGDTPEGSALSGGLLSKNPDRIWRSDTVAGCVANMAITGPRWLFSGTAPVQYRPVDVDTWGGWGKMVGYRAMYLLSLVAFVVFSLLVLAFAGASIARLSALEMAGFERPPLMEVFRFAWRRLWVFVKTPVAPFVILLVIGLALTVGGFFGAIPYVGEILLGLAFVAFLGIAIVLMLLLLGIIGGFNLLYPTVAVEGADAFDAMSRSFAYAYARPWRLLFYTVTALIYGVVTFLFVSFAVYLILLLTHTFVGWGASFFGFNYGAYSGMPKLDTMWPEPQFMRLVMPINWYAMSWSEFVGALFLHFWVFFLITGIGAYVISYYFSSHTIIYLLLRRSVDGQDIREVYLDEEEAPPAAAPATVASPAAPAAIPAEAGPSATALAGGGTAPMPSPRVEGGNG